MSNKIFLTIAFFILIGISAKGKGKSFDKFNDVILNNNFKLLPQKNILINKVEKLSDFQIQNLKIANINIPRNKKVINSYLLQFNNLILTQSKIVYDENDKTDGLYFGECIGYDVIMINFENIILFHQNFGQVFSSNCVIGLNKSVKISFDYSASSLRDGSASFNYSYINGKILNDKLSKKWLKDKYKQYFKIDDFWRHLALFDKK